MDLGMLPPYRSGIGADPVAMVELARLAEFSGVSTLYVVEHVAVAAGYADAYPYSTDGRMPLGEDCPIPDPLELIAFLSARTSTLRFNTGVLVAPHHHPLVLAKRLVTLDCLSGGRVDVGLGIGWMREEIESTGSEFSSRGRRTTELVRALRAALDEDPATHDGEFFGFTDMRVHPRPSRRIRIDIGGHGERAALRAGEVGDGLHPLALDDDTLARRWNLARSAAEAAGRDPDSLRLTVTLPVAAIDTGAVERMAGLGVSRIVCSTATSDPGRLAGELRRAAEAVAGVGQ
ncbi:MAG: TIGR03619 family F420-dependent LLM class oxidoreductase [Microthrixaceae bacterium]|nr:TIGR03619 family F420-dependent LLM class oxidoreductase [Microthrixaceae bacterium]